MFLNDDARLYYNSQSNLMISSQKYKQTEKLQNSFIPSPRNEQVFVN